MSTVVSHAKTYNLFLYVTITDKRGNGRSFKMKPDAYRNRIKKYCKFYNAIITGESYTDYEHTVHLSNGMKFNAILY